MPTQIEELYKRLPKSKCKDGCFICCTNIVQFAPEEQERAKNLYNNEYNINQDYIYNEVCNYLDKLNGRCKIYEARPLVCRIYGVSEIMTCEDCKPDCFLSHEDTREIIKEYTKIKNEQEKFL